MQSRLLLDHVELSIIIQRLSYQLHEKHNDFSNTALVALQPRGVHLGQRLLGLLHQIVRNKKIDYGELDVTFYRDDFRRREDVLIPSATSLNFTVENRKVVLIDDVLYTGRTVRAAMDALLDFGRPSSVELLTLIDRRFSRQLPVQPDYIGRTVDAISEETVKVNWTDDNSNNNVVLYTPKEQ